MLSGCETAWESKLLPAADFSGENYLGKVLLLNFWATWCQPCVYEIPALVELRTLFDSTDVAVVGVSLDKRMGHEPMRDLLKRVEGFVDRYGITYPVVLDNEGELKSRYYRTPVVPMTFIIDRNGEIYRAHQGLPTDRQGRIDPLGIYAEEIQDLLDRS